MSNYFIIKINAYQANTSKVYNIFIKFSNNYERIRNSNHIPYYSLQLNLLEKQTYVIRITSQMLFLFILEQYILDYISEKLSFLREQGNEERG